MEVLMKDKMLTYSEAAEKLGMPLGTVYSLVCQRRIPHVRLGRRLVRFSQNELDRWITDHKVESTSPLGSAVKGGSS